MIGIAKGSHACVALLFVLTLVTAPQAAAQEACSQWDVSGEWTFVQTNDTAPQFTLRHTEIGLQGSASYYPDYDPSSEFNVVISASVDGKTNGDHFELTAYWNDGTIGVYTGQIDPQGRIEGSTYDKNNPQTRADWYSDRTAMCASQAACSRWDMSGVWRFVQTNDSAPVFTLQQTRTGLQGTAVHEYIHEDENLPGFKVGDERYQHTASVNGAINGNSVELTAYWSNGTIGVYTGQIGPQGRIEGTTEDKNNPENTARWYSERTAKCLAGGTGEQIGTTSSALETAPAPPPQFIGTFSTTPANYQPMWVYAIKEDGDMLWYRKDSGESAWQGPKKVGNGWNFKDVIPAGGNSFYALTTEGKLIWYRHDGFNDGSSTNWPAPQEVGHGWNFAKIFSGGEGIIYAITQDGGLLWYRHNGYLTGAGLETPGAWEGPKEVGTGWNGFEQVFSAGGGVIYAITQDGKLRWYKHNGYLTGNGLGTPGAWEGPKEVGTGWNGFRQVVPAGAGVILLIENNGKLRWYRHKGYLTGAGTPDAWEGPKEVGTGWQGFKQVIALLPVASATVVR